MGWSGPVFGGFSGIYWILFNASRFLVLCATPCGFSFWAVFPWRAWRVLGWMFSKSRENRKRTGPFPRYPADNGSPLRPSCVSQRVLCFFRSFLTNRSPSVKWVEMFYGDAASIYSLKVLREFIFVTLFDIKRTFFYWLIIAFGYSRLFTPQRAKA